MTYPAPVAIFCYNRPNHLMKTVGALALNPEASNTVLHIFSDGASAEKDIPLVLEVRRFASAVNGFKEVNLHFAERNLGLSNSVIGGVSRVLESAESIIVLEDDMECVPFFLQYMNKALQFYQNDDSVVSIHAYTYPIKGLPESFFLYGADCWGWATWSRSWKIFDKDSGSLIKRIEQGRLKNQFDFNGSYPYFRMLKRHFEGKNDSWAIRWYASAFLDKKLTLYPGKSLIRNIGNDLSGTNTPKTDVFEPIMATAMPSFPERIEHSSKAYNLYAKFFRTSKWILKLEKLGLKIKWKS